MKLFRALPAATLALLLASGAVVAPAAFGPGAAWAQDDEEPTARNQDEGQLLPDQAEEVAPSEERNLYNTDPPAETGSIPAPTTTEPREVPGYSDDEPENTGSDISGKVEEEVNKGNP